MKLREYFRSGDAWVWLNAGTVTISLIMVVGIMGLIAVRGLGYFWPADVMQASYTEMDGSKKILIAEVYDEKIDTAQRLREAGVEIPAAVETVVRYSLKVGNRDLGGADFKWVFADRLENIKYPADIVALERYEWGSFFGRLKEVRQKGEPVAIGEQAWDVMQSRLDRAGELSKKISSLEKGDVSRINYALDQLRLEERRLVLRDALTAADVERFTAEKEKLEKEYEGVRLALEDLADKAARDSAVFVAADGIEKEITLDKIAAAHKPNDMNIFSKLATYFHNVWMFLSGDPREANTEGGVFPAIFGTVLMVLLMTILVTPLGVIAAIYLREYANQGFITQTVRIAVNNLAGVPSIVYGVFGLGFFVYFVGGSMDRIFYPEAAPSPVFGTPGLLWASITLALLTLPVVIVATEEGLSRIPRALKEGSLALGATKAETLWRVVLPMATPSIMTGVILAIARAAGEVAPLMLVGVVKLAPTLPLDMNAPFLHLDRKFMHLGFHIYDVGFQSPNVEAARPLVYATAFLLVLVVAALNLSAVGLRNRLREKYKALES
ncbi:MAG: phosphate ABC transporter permease PstA [Moraxellaceae bacterium]|jgi:phosphate transport system permease protein|nr:phosphate ABC transporter permease PstA [Moraxellaceae bacterium]MBP9046288.1 phosphate ABC transporter permease PstA [Moraxellaceae bacterium]MBP9730901.1 phosphate ABC transporter permease PstA [Moraxellaceae bacterium]HQV42173.1 phosphate ABC transporter permease PstA [Moraxellaceae bacterium]HQX90500.1 phosphate ABC transporter permease PstA [Moraxellaceae bacterium]